MGWEESLKSFIGLNIKEDLKLFHPYYEELIAHPDFNIDSRMIALPERKFIKNIMSGKYNLLDFNDEGLTHEDKVGILLKISNVKSLLKTLKKEAILNRSVDFLVSNAKAFGVTLRSSPKSILDTGMAQFEHRGLVFDLWGGGVRIRVPGIGSNIIICVVDKKKLPMGDFFAAMLGLIVAKPNELDVVDFGIQLGLIMLTYIDYDWDRAIGIRGIPIYTPFDSRNGENRSFKKMLNFIARDDHELAPFILEEIEGALEDCFGSTRGFF